VTFGWPSTISLNLPSGDLCPPLAAMGIRVKAETSGAFTLLATIFNRNAAGPGRGDPQQCNAYS
jgi:porin